MTAAASTIATSSAVTDRVLLRRMDFFATGKHISVAKKLVFDVEKIVSALNKCFWFVEITVSTMEMNASTREMIVSVAEKVLDEMEKVVSALDMTLSRTNKVISGTNNFCPWRT